MLHNVWKHIGNFDEEISYLSAWSLKNRTDFWKLVGGCGQNCTCSVTGFLHKFMQQDSLTIITLIRFAVHD
jgi:hypothetical protein